MWVKNFCSFILVALRQFNQTERIDSNYAVWIWPVHFPIPHGLGVERTLKKTITIKMCVPSTSLEDMDPILVLQKLSIAKFSVPSWNLQIRKSTETSEPSLANNDARRLTEPWTLSYSAHFTSEAKKDKLEQVLKKLNPVQYVHNLFPFLFPIEESKNVLLFKHK